MAAATTPSGPTPHARSRSGRARSRFASASPTNSSFAGPSLSLRPSTQASAAAWQATAPPTRQPDKAAATRSANQPCLGMRRSHVACHAAALAWVLGRKLRLDPAKEEFVGDAEANRLRSRPERDWTA